MINNKILLYNKIGDSMKNKEKMLHICIMILPLLFTLSLFILFHVDGRGCSSLFGGLSDECTTTNYLIWFYFSIPLAVISLVGGIVKTPTLVKVAAILFLLFNLFLLFITRSNNLHELEVTSIIFSGILIYLENKLIKKESKKK